MSTLHERLEQRTKAAKESYRQEKEWVQNRINNAKTSAAISRLDNPINSPSVSAAVRDIQSAQIASRLSNPVSSPAIRSTQGANIASRLDGGTYAATGGAVQERIAQQKKDQRSAQLASNLDNSLMGQATRDENIRRLNSAMDSLYTRMEGYRNNGQAAELARSERQYKLLDERLEANKSAGGAMEKATVETPKQSPFKTAFDVVDRGAGYFNQGVASTIDFVANAMPRLEGAVFGVDPAATFTGQVLKPVTDATGKFKDWVDQTVANIDQRVQTDTKDNKAASIAANLGSQAVAALPNAVLAFLSGGGSAATQLAAQPTGISGAVTSAATKALKNPMTGVSFAQSLGRSYEEAKASGASDVEAMTAATLSSLFNAAIETGGGIETLPDEIRGKDLSTAQKALEWVKSALEEGGEEVVQSVITNMTNKSIFDADKPLVSTTDENAVVNPYRMLQEFGSGAAVGGILGGGQMIGSTVIDSIMPRLQKNTQTVGNDQVAQMVQGMTEQNKNAPVNETKTESTSVNTDPANHTRVEQRVIDDFQKSVDDGLVAFARDTLSGNGSNTAKNQRYQLSPVSDRAAADILRETNVNTSGFSTAIERRAIEHINLRHGKDGNTDHSMQDLNDLGRIQYVLDNYDNVSAGGNSSAYTTIKPNGKPGQAKTVVFEKAVNGTYYVVEAVPDTKAKTTFVVSAYMSQNGAKKPKAEQTADTASSPDVYVQNENARASGDSSIPVSPENVNGGNVGDMGAKTSDFRHEVRESQTGSNTIAQSEEEANVPEEQRRTLYYDTMSEEESLHNARERLDLDYEGEMDALARAAVWSNEEVDMGMAILRDLQAEAAETGDWSAYRRWRETVKQHGVASGQGLQAWAKYTRRTGDRLLEDSSDILEDYDGDDADEIMDEINDLSDDFDDADENLNVDDLLAIIRRTSATRRTGTFFRNRFSRQMEWALQRVAEYARNEVASGNAGENFEYLLDFAYNGIRNIAEDHIRPAASDVYLTIRRNAMLSKASTTMRNLVGNNVFDPLDSVAGNISVPLDALLSTFTGTRSVAFDRSWASAAKRQGALDGLARAMLETGLDVHVAQEAGRYENTANRTFKMSGGVFSRLMSSWEKWMGYALNATDEFQKGGIEAETQRGIDRLYERGRIAADDDSLRNAGEQEALYRTFQDNTAIYRAVQGIREGLNQFHVGNLGVGDLAIPFARVPANLPARAMDYSPIGLARGMGRLGRVLYDAHNGNLTAAQQAQAVKDIGRGITGSSLIVAATALALKGVIHVVGPGGEEESKDKAASDKAKGLSGTQLNVSAMIRAAEGGSTEWQDGDTLMSIGFLDPINAQLTTGALIAEDIRSGEADAGTILQDSFTGTLQSLLDLPVMQTFQEVANAYQYSEGETSGEKMVDAGKQWLASEAVSTIPNSLKGIAQGMDEYQRDVYAKDDLLGQTIDQMIGSVPGMRDRLTAKQDVYGNDVKNPDQPLNFLNSNILPGAITTYTETDLMRVLDDLAEQTGSNAAYLSKNAPKTVTVGDETVALSKDQQRQFMTERGKVYEAASAAIQDSGKFQKLSKEMQLKVYEYAEKFATQAAEAALGIGYEIDTKWMREIASKSADWQAKAIIDRAIENAKK